jgi:RNA polymerase sigma-70 factor (ECF subfamily)
LQTIVSQDEFVQLVNQHQSILYKLCSLYCSTAHDRQDLFQEIVIQLWKSYPKFRGESKFSTWLYRIALNTAISDLRKQKNQPRVPRSEPFPEQMQEIPDYGEKDLQVQQLYAAISQLTDLEKALVMLYLEDKTYREMEEILGMNENNLRVKMNRIKEKIRKLTKEASYGTGHS